MLKTYTHGFIEEIIKSIENRHESLQISIEESEFRHNYVSKLTIKCITLNEPKVSSYIK